MQRIHLKTSMGLAMLASIFVAACGSEGSSSSGTGGVLGGTFAGTGGTDAFGTGGSAVTTGGSTGGVLAIASGAVLAGATGGVSTTGGVAASGGAQSTGGTQTTGGGQSTGGTQTTGGASATGGAQSTGGEQSTGGMQSTGGALPEKFCGNITTSGMVRSDFITYWDQITPENEGKWGSVEGTRDQMNWGGLDAVYNYAKQNNIPFKEHTLVWGSQQPGWIGGLSQSEQAAEVEEWIRLFCERYPDTQLIDVVNEPPPHTTPPYTDALGGAGASGYDWIVQAFKWARQYCPNSILILNDYNTIEYGNDNSHIIDIVNAIKAAGAPIDAIGAQAHAAYNMQTSTVEMYINNLANSTGLPVYISEYDINIADDNQQKTVMESQFTMFWNNDNIKGVTLWGYIEGQTWQTNTGLMSSGGTQRPAMTWLMDFLGR